jgi:hypothetical protein
MNRAWAKLGGQLGMGCIAVGILLIGLGWNGAAGVDFVAGQIPYLLSGAALGLALVAVGSTLIVVENSRRDRSLVETQLRELNTALGRLTVLLGEPQTGNGRASAARAATAEQVVMGRSSYHRAGCRLVEGKDLPTGTVELAQHEGLRPCRVCKPAVLEPLEAIDV